MPTQYCLALLELNGIGFSIAECEVQKHVMQAKLSALEAQAYQLAGHSFSLTNPEDIAEVTVLSPLWLKFSTKFIEQFNIPLHFNCRRYCFLS